MPSSSGRRVLSVRALTLYIKELLGKDELLGGLWVRGEISNFKHHGSGHMYFTLKDEAAQVKCVMFRSDAQRLKFRPENGTKVIAAGYIGVYERDGAYQLYVQAMEPEGLGALHLAFEQLKTRLEAEGLFDPARKRRPPILPRKVGLVTSPTGAAVRDMITVARRRFPNVHIVLAPAQVQGDDAPRTLIQALGRVAQVAGVDVVIIGRGGGSLEELWAFNDEGLARAIYACPVPVISAVGHETDFTISDLVADLRAPTPSAAAELAVPARSELQAAVAAATARMGGALRSRLRRARERVQLLAGRPVLRRPKQAILQAGQRVDDLSRRLGLAVGSDLRSHRRRLEGLGGRLDALSPLAVLSRGYAIARDAGGRVLREAAAAAPGDPVEVLLHRGRLQARVESVHPAAAGPAQPDGEH